MRCFEQGRNHVPVDLNARLVTLYVTASIPHALIKERRFVRRRHPKILARFPLPTLSMAASTLFKFPAIGDDNSVKSRQGLERFLGVVINGLTEVAVAAEIFGRVRVQGGSRKAFGSTLWYSQLR